jgi:rubredoxin
MNNHNCRVCGFYIEGKPWGDDGKTPSYEICPCCGVEFGNEDYTVESIKKYRDNWVGKGMVWFDSNLTPTGWNFEEQFKNVSIEFR